MSSKKSLLSEDGVEYECTSQILVKPSSLIFTSAELLATSHIFFKDGQSTCNKRIGQDFPKNLLKVMMLPFK